MENSNQYDELLVRYLTGDLNDEEKAHVENWLAAAPNRKYFDELKAIWNLAQLNHSSKHIDISKEWLHFQQTIGAASAETITEQSNIKDDDVDPVLQIQPRHGILYRLSVAAAVAAAVVLIAGLGWKFFYSNKKEVQVAQQIKSDTSRVFIMHHASNTSGKDKKIYMSDSSLIILADRSEITYAEPFSQKRDIDLTGKAFFKVAKGRPVPFMVTSRDITTTAIGTEFTVTAFKNDDQLSVRLHEGKVVVKPADKTDPKMKEAVYLLPGQELLYSYKTGVTVRAFRTKPVAQSSDKVSEPAEDSPDIPDNIKGSWYMFNNQSLEEVFISLSALYNVKILYNKKDIAKIYFTGKYDKAESLETILNRIGTINKLTVTKNDTAFIISK
ncbi:FecR domain-containing protein [Parafilimonas sp.]|uniref:FecR domain-containing protein n=1 Tax=Parafilimonas sp. TaxID=1969739 RepID=UPI003F7FCA12